MVLFLLPQAINRSYKINTTSCIPIHWQCTDLCRCLYSLMVVAVHSRALGLSQNQPSNVFSSISLFTSTRHHKSIISSAYPKNKHSAQHNSSSVSAHESLTCISSPTSANISSTLSEEEKKLMEPFWHEVSLIRGEVTCLSITEIDILKSDYKPTSFLPVSINVHLCEPCC